MNQKISTKLMILLISLILFMLTMGLLGITSINKINSNAKEMYESKMMANEYLSELIQLNVQIESRETEIVLGEINVKTDELENEINEFITAENEVQLKLEEMGMDAESQVLYTSYKDLSVIVRNEFDKVQGLLNEGKELEAYMFFNNRLSEIRTSIVSTLTQIKQLNLADASSFNESNKTDASASRLMVTSVLVIVVLLGGFFGYFVYVTIKKPINQLIADLKRVENGDLTARNDYNWKNEFGDLSNSFNNMVTGLHTIVDKVSINSESVASSSEELLAAAEQSASHTSKIASDVTQIAAQSQTQFAHAQESSRSMEEVAIGIQRISESASNVSELANQANDQAMVGQERMASIHKQMTLILQGSKNTTEVIKNFSEQTTTIGRSVMYIQEIAEQVNLLALNASIEAARAGEHGRGFAVVADEVRNLADSSKKAAKEISTLVTRIQDQSQATVEVVEHEQVEVTNGMSEVELTHEVFEKIVNSISVVNAQLQEVTAAAEEMSASTEQVSAALTEMTQLSDAAASQASQVAEITQEQDQVMVEVKSNVQDLTEIAVELQQQSQRFTIR